MVIKNGLVYDFEEKIGGRKLDILIKEGRIKKISPSIDAADGPVIDASSMYVIPGLVDLHAHLREPGETQKETLESGSRAAARGGITTLLAMPNTLPPADNPELISSLVKKAASIAPVSILFASCMTIKREGLYPVDIAKNREAGCAAFSDDGSSIQDLNVLIGLCRAAADQKVLLIDHPEIRALSGNGPVSYGQLPLKFGLEGQPAEAESLAIWTLGSAAGLFGAQVHFTHISTRKSAEAVRMLKSYYPGRISCDTTPHHLLLSEEDLLKILDTNKKINPPLRPEDDRRAVEEALCAGVIDAIATDHAPHTDEEKSRPFESAPFGTIGFETFLASTYTHLVRKRGLNVLDWLRMVTSSPSGILGIERGVIRTGGRADITVFHPGKKFTVEREAIISKSKNSAFLGMTFYGNVEYTIAGGRIAYPFNLF